MPTDINIKAHWVHRRGMNPLLMTLLVVYAICIAVMLSALFVPTQEILTVAAP